MAITRRKMVIGMLGLSGLAAAAMAGPKRVIKSALLRIERFISPIEISKPETPSDVYAAKNGTPQQNVAKVLEMMGGIERFVGPRDIVILKPNAQWWNQGRTNLAAMKGFIDLVLGIPGFSGEIIIGENHHFMDESLPDDQKDDVRGWVHLGEINGDIDGVNHSLNTLVAMYHSRGAMNVTKSHWRDGGAKADVWGNGRNGGIVASPADGDGYVWTDDDYVFEGLWGFKKWKVRMTYPVFTSAYSGITIDFKNGAFQRDGKSGGGYLPDRPLKFINFSVLNDHGGDTGVTGAVKNYMGITDLSCGWWGHQPEGYVNVHACGSDYYPYAKGGPLGHFLRHVRAADLNLVTAEWVGWGSRTDAAKASRLKTVLAGTDPIALDYYGAKHLLYPLSNNRNLHDPDNPESAFARFLALAQKSYGQGALQEADIRLHGHNFNRT